jgi:hypothetical protein
MFDICFFFCEVLWYAFCMVGIKWLAGDGVKRIIRLKMFRTSRLWRLTAERRVTHVLTD